jgi:autotransporter-associated beta strand protein
MNSARNSLPAAVKTIFLSFCLLIAGFSSQAASGTWTNILGSPTAWSSGTNWLNGVVPNAPGDSASISADFTGAYTINLASASTNTITLGSLSIGDPTPPYFPFTLSFGLSGAKLVFDNNGSGAALNFPVTAGASTTINGGVTITLNDNLTITADTPYATNNAFNGAITDGANSYGITKNGAGSIVLAGANTFHGGVIINAGRVQANSSTCFGTNMATVTVSAGAQVYLTASPFNAYSIAGIGPTEPSGNLGAIRLDGNNVNGPVTLTADARIAAHGVTGNINQPVSGNFELEIANTSPTAQALLGIGSTNNTVASTRLTSLGGLLLLSLNKSNALSAGPLKMMNNTTLNLNGKSAAFASITNLGGTPYILNNSSTAPGTLTLGLGDASSMFDGIVTNGSGVVSLTKVGAGTLTLNAADGYTGTTTISNGTLALGSSGSINNSTNIFIVSGAVFDASASGGFALGPNQALTGGRSSGFDTDINGNLTNSGTLSPSGTLTINGGLAFNSGSALNFDLMNNNTNAGGGVNDLIANNGGLSLPFLGSVTVNVNWLGGPPQPGTYTLVSGNGGLASGALSSLAFGNGFVSGSRTTYAFDISSTPGSLFLNVGGSPSASLTWAGTSGNLWDLQGTQNWLNVGNPDVFYQNDSVTFNDSASNGNVDLEADVAPAFVVVSNSATTYTLSGSGSITNVNSFTKTSNGTLVLNLTNSFKAAPALNGGIVQVPSVASNNISSPLGAGTGISFNGGTLEYVGVSGGSFNRSLTLNSGGGAIKTTTSPLTNSGSILGAGTLTKTGNGTLVLSSNNTSSFTGNVNIENGELQLGSGTNLSNATIYLGTANSGSDTTKLRFGSTTVNLGTLSSSPIIISSNAPSSVAMLDGNTNSTVVGQVSSSITLQNRSVWFTNSASSKIYNVSGLISGTGDVIVSTASYGMRLRLTRSSGNTFSGNLIITNGGLQITDSAGAGANYNVIPDTSDVIMAANTTLGFGASETFGALDGDATAMIGVNSSSTGTYTLRLGANDHDGVYNGTIILGDIGGTTSRDISIIKIGAGTQTFNGNCSNTAPTSVGGGTMIINSAYFASAVTVSNNATLGGTGTLSSNVTVQAGGTLSPGASIGTLVINGNLTNAGNLYIGVDKSQLVQSNDIVNVGGMLTNSGTGTVTMANLNLARPFANGDKFTLFSKPLANGGAMTISPSTPGPGLAWNNNLAMDGSIGVYATVNTTPVPITFSVSGSTLTLSWPADHLGWHLQMQTNTLGAGLRTNGWVVVPGSDQITSTNISITKTNPTVFYRITYP